MGGYSGVATFCRSASAAPTDVREGVSWGVDAVWDSVFFPDGTSKTDARVIEELSVAELKANSSLLDSEGRCIWTDHGSFCLFNAYFPAVRTDPEGTVDEERLRYKMLFNRAFQCCVYETHVRQGREVLLVGDFNISAADGEAGDDPSPSKKWLASMMKSYNLIDAFRERHPLRKDAFTCWNQEKGCRQTNYGSRVDYIIASRTLNDDVLETCEIWPEFMGSDHCPIVTDLPDRIYGTTEEESDAHPLCARFRAEAKIRQKSLLSFMGQAPLSGHGGVLKEGGVNEESPRANDNDEHSRRCSSPVYESCVNPVSSLRVDRKRERNFICEATKRRKTGVNGGALGNEKTTERLGSTRQQNLHSFVGLREPSVHGATRAYQENTSISSMIVIEDNSPADGASARGDLAPEHKKLGSLAGLREGGSNRRENELSRVPAQPVGIGRSAGSARPEAMTARRSCLQYKEPNRKFDASVILEAISFLSEKEQKMYRAKMDVAPLCSGHGIPCVERAVKKEGVNKGRKFWSCVRAVGQPTNATARCNYFVWSDVAAKPPKVVKE